MKPCRYLNTILLISVLCVTLGAQSGGQPPGERLSDGERPSDIVLPDITTHIEGETAAVDPAAVPVVQADDPVPEVNTLPSLAEVRIPPEVYTSEEEKTAALKGKNAVFIEGTAGGGYPGVFIGAFSLFQPLGDRSWRLNFSHESALGYQNRMASRGYFDTDTLFSGEAEFALSDSVTLNLAGGYDTVTVGMQGRSDYYYNSTAQRIGVDAGVFWELPAGFTLSGGMDGRFLNQYMGYVGSRTPDVYTGMNLFILEPSAAAGWAGEVFSARFDAAYRLDALRDPETDYGHRGEFSLEGACTVSGFTLTASAGVVVRSDGTLLIPFAVSAAADLPAKTVIALSGGMNARPASVQDLLRREPFIRMDAAGDTAAPEESDWFGSLSVSWAGIPGLTLSGHADFLKTASGYGEFVSSYEAYGTQAASVSGLFDRVIWERTMLNTLLLAEYSYKLVTAAAGWRAHWIDHNRMSAPRQIIGRVAVSPESGNWGVGIEAAAGLESGYIPEIALSGFIAIHKGLRIRAELLDIGTLFDSDGRIRAVPYIKRGPEAIVKLQLLF
ncbi:MAG: hypothetical protein LBR47_06475 [Spirochaetaceae bacterium]|jgi:hypothetical protein|nr:hypothetical protein [Spirochaetaceae bacterium]